MSSAEEPDRPPLPPFTADTALKKVKAAEAAWNRKDVDAIAAAYSEDSEWRNRAEFVKGRENIKAGMSEALPFFWQKTAHQCAHMCTRMRILYCSVLFRAVISASLM